MADHPPNERVLDPSEDFLGWAYCTPKLGTRGDQHVIPMNDVKEHVLQKDCWCHPVDDEENPNVCWMHNALDGREEIQSGQFKLN